METVILRDKDFPVILATVIDDCLVNNTQEGHEDLLTFNRIWQTRFSSDSLLIYATDRTPKQFEDLKANTPLINPKVIICSCGTEIYFSQKYRGFMLDVEWKAKLNANWDKNEIFRLIVSLRIKQLTLKEKTEQRSHKISFNIDTGNEATDPVLLVERLKSALEKSKFSAKVIFRNNQHVDIVPNLAGQGNALQHLRDRIASYDCLPRLGILVNGVSENDIDLFKVKGVYGCAVGNSKNELINWIHNQPSLDNFIADENCAAGIVRGMRYFGFLTEHLDHKMKVQNDIFASLECRVRNLDCPWSKLSDSFFFEIYEKKTFAKYGVIDFPELFSVKPSPLVYIDKFSKTESSSASGNNSGYKSYFEVYDLRSTWGSKYKIAGFLKSHVESGMIIWDSVDVEMEIRGYDLCHDLCKTTPFFQL